MNCILEIAKKVTRSDRRHHYGHPLENHTRTAEFWSVYLGTKVTAEQVCMMNILQKVSRSMNKITEDTLIDIAGYAKNIQMIEEKRKVYKV
jgi:hypothetical protein